MSTTSTSTSPSAAPAPPDAYGSAIALARAIAPICDPLAEGVVLLDAACAVRYLNRAAAAILALAPAQILGRDIFEAVPVLRGSPVAEAIADTMVNGGERLFATADPSGIAGGAYECRVTAYASGAVLVFGTSPLPDGVEALDAALAQALSQRSESDTLAHIARTLTGATENVEELLRLLAEGAMTLLEAEGADVALVDGSGLRLAAAAGLLSALPPEMTTIDRSPATSAAIDERRVIIANAIAPETRFAGRTAGELGIRSGLFAPLIVGDVPHGVIVVVNSARGGFGEEDAALLGRLADHGALILHNGRLLHTARQRARESVALGEIVREINQSLDPERIFDHVVQHAAELLGGEGARVALLEGEELVVRAACGTPAIGVGERVRLDDTFAGPGVRDRRPVRVDDLRAVAERFPYSARVASRSARANAVAAPLLVSGEPIGSLMVFGNQARDFDWHDERLLLNLANHAALAIVNARRLETERRERREAEIAARVARVALAGDGTATASRRLLETLDDALPTSGKAFVLATDAHPHRLRVVAATGSLAPAADHELVVRRSRLHVVFDRGIMRVADIAQLGGRALAGRIPHEVGVLMPLAARSRALGALVVATGDTPLGVDGAAQLERLAATIALAVDAVLTSEEERRVEDQLRQTEKLAALGELVAGVAHEVNNPLAGISAFAQLLMEEPLAPEQRESVRLIKREADRAVAVIRNLLAFARKTPPRETLVDLAEVVRSVIELRAYGLRASGVEVVDALAPVPPVLGDEQKLQQVILNLVLNAEQAMQHAPVRRLTIVTRVAGGEVVAEVADTGPGIPGELQQRIFEPFFTTKPEGSGTGLGLSVSYGIATAHGGSLAVRSSPGSGATFRLAVPVAPAAAPTPASPPPFTANVV